MASAKTREYSFDVVKFLAISIIVLHHYQEVTGAFFQYGPNWYDGAFYWGYLVELFFIISGYFTFASIEKVRSGVSFGAFYIRKYLRFLPMIVICGIVCLVTKYLFLTYVDHEPSVSFTIWNVVSSLACVARWFDTSLMINNPMWYVSVLLLCLAVFYFVTRRCRKADNLVLAYGMVIALGLVMRSMCVDGFKAPFFNIDIARGLISFFIGLELALVIKRHSRIVNAASIVAAITAICLFVAFCATNRDGLVGSETSQYYALVFLVYPSVIVICKAPILTRLFSSERLSFVGGCAYNMYVWHLPLIFLYCTAFYGLGLNSERQIAMYAFLTLCFMAGMLSDRLIDRPIAKRVMRRLSGAR